MLESLQAGLVGRYRLDREVGRGGMASVWLAHDLRHDRPVALKVLHPELGSAIGVDRFLREIRITAGLQHPGIVPLLDSGVIHDSTGTPLPWFAMGYIQGESLRVRLDREGQLPVDEARRIAVETADALAAAHRAGIVHRDIKPENLLLADGRVHVADFGIARAVADGNGDRLTSTGLAIGTPPYMSPEQATASAVDARTDQYSLACVLYEMLTGQPPFTGATAQAVIARRLVEPARAMRPVRPTIPVGTEAVVLRALERVPADRFPDITAFARSLQTGQAPRPLVPGRRLLMGILAALLATVVIATALRSRRPAPPATDPALEVRIAQGLRALEKRTPAGASEAIDAFGSAVGRDSLSAPAWAGLGRAYGQAYMRSFVNGEEAQDSLLRLAVRAIDRALVLDPTNPQGWIARSSLMRLVDPTDARPAIEAARRAIALDSTQGLAWFQLGVSLGDAGQLGQAMDAWRRAVTYHPSNAEVLSFLAIGHYWQRQYDSAAHWADSAIAVDPASNLGRSTQGYVEVERGHHGRAEAAFEAQRRLATEVEVTNALGGIATSQARAGNLRAARQQLALADARARNLVPVPLHTAVYLAAAHASVGDADGAMALLQKFHPAANLHFQLHLTCDPRLDTLRADPRFRRLLVPRPSCTGDTQALR